MTEPIFRSDMIVNLVDSMGDEDTIVNAARVSSGSVADQHSQAANKGLIRALIREGHGTPVEYPDLIWHLEVPIFVSRQIVKHRLSTINEVSGRYSDLDPVFYSPAPGRPVQQVGKTMNYEFAPGDTPEALDLLEDVRDEMETVAIHAWQSYKYLRDRGVAKELARQHLPVNLYTRLYMKMNLRSTLHFITQRTERDDADRVSHAQHEIELVARQMEEIIKTKFPTVWDAYAATGYKKL